MPRPSLTTRTEQVRHVGAAVDTLLELLEGDLRHLSAEDLADALARGVVWALVKRYRGRGPLSKVVERLRLAADHIEGRQAPAESGPVTQRSPGRAA